MHHCASTATASAHLPVLNRVRVLVAPHMRDDLAPHALEHRLAGQEIRVARLPAVVADLGRRLHFGLLHTVGTVTDVGLGQDTSLRLTPIILQSVNVCCAAKLHEWCMAHLARRHEHPGRLPQVRHRVRLDRQRLAVVPRAAHAAVVRQQAADVAALHVLRGAGEI